MYISLILFYIKLFHFTITTSLKITLYSCVSYFMTNSSHVSCVSQHRQIHLGIHIYHMCNTLFDLTIILNFLLVMDITTFDVSHDGNI